MCDDVGEARINQRDPHNTMNPEPMYKKLASLVGARNRCVNGNYPGWLDKHTEGIKSLVRDHAPSGSGFDNGTKIDLDASTDEKLVFHTSFHHMNENGMYDGWTEHTVTVRPSLWSDFHVTIGGRDRNRIKEYMRDVFYDFLTYVETPALTAV